MDARGADTAAEERFHLLVDGVTEYAIFMLDPDGTIATWNAGAQRIKGYREDEIVGRHFSVFFVDDDVVDGRPERLLAQAAAGGRVTDEGWRRRKDGSRFWASVVLTALRSDDGALRGFAKVTRDDTERQRASDERVQLQVLELRERIGEDLHHEVIERLFDVGMLLTGASRLAVVPEVAERLYKAVDELDDLIRHIRTTLWASGAQPSSQIGSAVSELGEAEATAGARPLNILVVEDDDDVQALIMQILAAVGVVHVAPDVYQALAWLESEPVDVMVLDLVLPGANGLELLRRARNNGLDVPTVVVTGMTGPSGVAAAAADAGAAVILTKPFDAALLRDAVVDAARA